MSQEEGFPTAADCDVMLLLEGTFPFVSGGVSSWVNQIIRGFPHIRYGICFIGSRRSDYSAPKYKLPDNVVHVETHFIHETQNKPPIKPTRGDVKAFAEATRLHELFCAPLASGADNEKIAQAMDALVPLMRDGAALDEATFLYSEASWHYLTEQYRAFCTDPSFVDYFWTVRMMHGPIWQLARVAQNLIPSRAFHTVSTGYAGLLGAMLKRQTGRPLILSEHGIYTKERKIDLFQSEWIQDNRSIFEKNASELSYFRDLWIRFFEALGRICYTASSDIVALYETNRLRQVNDGAPAERTRNIPNGIDLPRLEKLRPLRPETPPQVMCLIGRVVPIKDVKTFIRAMRTVINILPDAEGWIAGPEDEDASYAQECRNIADGLGLAGKVKFLGFQKIDELMPKIGLIILSSISEALPLVLLEGFAAGVPAVTTDVGSCRQLIYGLTDDDKAFGAAGEVVGIAEPVELAKAAVSLLGDLPRWHAAQAAGVKRVEKYYTQDLMFGQYRELYDKALNDDGEGKAAPLKCPMGH